LWDNDASLTIQHLIFDFYASAYRQTMHETARIIGVCRSCVLFFGLTPFTMGAARLITVVTNQVFVLFRHVIRQSLRWLGKRVVGTEELFSADEQSN